MQNCHSTSYIDLNTFYCKQNQTKVKRVAEKKIRSNSIIFKAKTEKTSDYRAVVCNDYLALIVAVCLVHSECLGKPQAQVLCQECWAKLFFYNYDYNYTSLDFFSYSSFLWFLEVLRSSYWKLTLKICHFFFRENEIKNWTR